LFSEHLEITPKKYINTKRLILAQKKIRQGEKPTQIYPKCGFSEYSTFWREYKNYFGYSPSEEADREIVLKTFF
ncbi:MAG: helix-turn-helix domain-containing protein, partial [Ruminococcaceae bacterium]|nr:helix-turn-helix domain-containing protein [Oscillospiraceae bacterium]